MLSEFQIGQINAAAALLLEPQRRALFLKALHNRLTGAPRSDGEVIDSIALVLGTLGVSAPRQQRREFYANRNPRRRAG